MSGNQIYGENAYIAAQGSQGLKAPYDYPQDQRSLGSVGISKDSRDGAIRRALEEQAGALKDLTEVASMFVSMVSPILSPVSDNSTREPRPNTPSHSEIENAIRSNTITAIELAQKLRVASRHVAI